MNELDQLLSGIKHWPHVTFSGVNLKLLPPAGGSAISIPSLIDPTQCWDGEAPEANIWTAFMNVVFTSSKSTFNVLMDGQAVKSSERQDAIAQVFRQLSSCATETPQYSLMNVWLKKFALKPPISLRSHFRITEDSFDLGVNATPKGSFVDLHIDGNRHGISHTLGSCEKIWLLFPPTENNLKVFMSTVGHYGRLAKSLDRLEEGYICRTRSSQAIYLPPGWLHATFTTAGGLLVGINFDVMETLPQMSFGLGIHLKYFEYEPKYVEEDLDVYFKCLLKSLEDKDEYLVRTSILPSWAELCSSIKNISLTENGRGVLKAWERNCLTAWKEYASDMCGYCSVCLQDLTDTASHVLKCHHL